MAKATQFGQRLWTQRKREKERERQFWREEITKKNEGKKKKSNDVTNRLGIRTKMVIF